MKTVNTWNARNFVYDKLIDYLGSRVSLMGRNYGQLRLKNDVEITVYSRIVGIDLSLCLVDHNGKYNNYTKSYELDKLNDLFSEMETKISDLLTQQETKRQQLQKIWGQR